MNKKHWISVYPGEEISEALIRDSDQRFVESGG